MKYVRFLVAIGLWGGLAGCHTLIPSALIDNLPSWASPLIESRVLDKSTLPLLEAQIYQRVNQYRQSRNLVPLALDSTISQQARLHSQRMAANLIPVGHAELDQRARAIALIVPYESVGENVAMNQGYDDPVEIAVAGWIQSQGHRENMEGDFDTTGLGAARDSQGKLYFTQIFVKQRSSVPSVASANPLPNQSRLINLEQAANQQVNQYRLSQHLPPLSLDPQISYEARLFSQKMAGREVPFGHEGFASRVSAVQAKVPLQNMGENLALIQGASDPVQEALQGWIKRPDYQKNLVGDYDRTGIGIAQNVEGDYYFTQFFVKKR